MEPGRALKLVSSLGIEMDAYEITPSSWGVIGKILPVRYLIGIAGRSIRNIPQITEKAQIGDAERYGGQQPR